MGGGIFSFRFDAIELMAHCGDKFFGATMDENTFGWVAASEHDCGSGTVSKLANFSYLFGISSTVGFFSFIDRTVFSFDIFSNAPSMELECIWLSFSMWRWVWGTSLEGY